MHKCNIDIGERCVENTLLLTTEYKILMSIKRIMVMKIVNIVAISTQDIIGIIESHLVVHQH
jgi:hypothetical protein